MSFKKFFQYGNLGFKLIRSKISKKSWPISVSFHVTKNCNLRCKHCYAFLDSLNKDISIILDLGIPGYKNVYRTISDEKRIISDVLSNHSSFSRKYDLCSEFLKNESELWLKLSEYNRILLNKGLFLTIPKALTLLNEMDQIMDEIIEIEQKILSI